MKPIFIDITDVYGNSVTINSSQIVQMYDAADRAVIELSNGKTIQVKLRVMAIKGLIKGNDSE